MEYIIKTELNGFESYYARCGSGSGSGFSKEQAQIAGRFKSLARATRCATRLQEAGYVTTIVEVN